MSKSHEQKPDYFYYAYYKPRGIECTMNPTILNNLLDAVSIPKPFFPLGRLDKESEGLLILTNDGQLYKESVGSETFKEKEYKVKVNKIITDEMIKALSEGIEIMGQKTRPATVHRIDDFNFTIILTQGLNRQIRRMCYKLEYEVTSLIRTRMLSYKMDNLKPGDLIEISREQLIP